MLCFKINTTCSRAISNLWGVMTMFNRRTFLVGSAAIPFFSYVTLLDAFADTPKDVLVVAQQLDNMTSLDPHEGFEGVGSEMGANIYQRLVRANPDKPTQLDGDLAESWTASEDGKSITFKLRKEAKFSSGNPVTAEDAAFSLQRAVIMNKTPAFIITQFGFDKDNVTNAIKATDPNTLVITLDKPTSPSFLLYCLSANVGSIVEKKAVMEKEKDGDWGNNWLRNNSAGSGFFSLRAWKPSESVMLDVNPNSLHKSQMKRILFRHIVDPSAQLLMLQKGDVDVARNLTTEQLRVLQNDTNFNLVTQGVATIVLISLNQKIPQLAKPEVWQAVKWALDYDGIQKNIVPLTHKVHQSFLPGGYPGAVMDTPFKRDVTKARELMKKAGFENGFEIAMDHYANQPYPDMAQAIQANLADIGIRVKLQAAENRAVLTKMRARQHEVALTAWGADYFDPHTNAEALCYNSDNSDDAKRRTFCWRSAYYSPEMNKAVETALNELDAEKRIALYDKLQRDHMDNSPFTILLQSVYTAACRKNVKGVRIGILSDGTYEKVTKA